MTKENFRKTAVRNNMRDTGQTYTQASEELRANETVEKEAISSRESQLTFEDIITREGDQRFLLNNIFEIPNPTLIVVGERESGKSTFIDLYLQKLAETKKVGHLNTSQSYAVKDIKNIVTFGNITYPFRGHNQQVTQHDGINALIKSHQLGLKAVALDVELGDDTHYQKFFNETLSDSAREFLFIGVGSRIHFYHSMSEELPDHILVKHAKLRLQHNNGSAVNQNILIIKLKRTNRIVGPQFTYELMV